MKNFSTLWNSGVPCGESFIASEKECRVGDAPAAQAGPTSQVVQVWRGVQSRSGAWDHFRSKGRLGPGIYFTDSRKQATDYATTKLISAKINKADLFDATNAPASPEFLDEVAQRIERVHENRDNWYCWNEYPGDTFQEKFRGLVKATGGDPDKPRKADVWMFLGDVEINAYQESVDRMREMGYKGIFSNAEYGGGSRGASGKSELMYNVFQAEDVKDIVEDTPAIRPHVASTGIVASLKKRGALDTNKLTVAAGREAGLSREQIASKEWQKLVYLMARREQRRGNLTSEKSVQSGRPIRVWKFGRYFKG